MSFAQAVASGWSNWTDFDGRARRSEYWYWHLFTLLATITMILGGHVIGLLSDDLPAASQYTAIAAMLFLAFTIVPSFAVLVRRLHDISASGWLILIAFIPLAGPLILLILTVIPGKRGENSYGPDSRASGEDARTLLIDRPMLMDRPTPGQGGLPIALVAVCLIAVGAGGFYFFKNPNFLKNPAALWTALTSANQADRPWVLPEGTASMGEAENCLRTADLPCAEADMLAYLKRYPNDSHATALLAITLTEDGRHKEALYYYRRAGAMGVATYDFYAGYAKTLDAMGDTDGAIAKNQAALKLVPRLVDVRGSLADELVKKGRRKEALELLTSFDDQLEAEGEPPYFAEQVARIKKDMGGDDAKEASGKDAVLPKALPGQTLVKGEPDRGTLAVPVSIDGAEAKLFTIDSGASMMIMPYADAQSLLKLGLMQPGDYLGDRQIQLADGRFELAELYRLRSVKVGDREVQDVTAAFYLGKGPRLLGQTFLKRFKSWSIDNDKRVLVLTD